jgi:hypothetical protein
MPSV